MRALALVVVIGCASNVCPVVSHPEPHRSFAWEVTGAHGSMIVVATHQGAGPDDVSARAWTALDRAAVFITEADELGPADEWRGALLLPRGQSLERMLGARDFARLVDNLGSTPDHVDRMKPWVALFALAQAAYEYPASNINAALLSRARKRGIPVEFLDTWSDQTRYLDTAITPVKLAAAIHDFPKLRCSLPERLVAFRAGDDRWFINEVGPGDGHVVARIDRWLARLLPHLETGRTTFVAIGIGQLVGPAGLLNRLAAEGYQVRQL